MKSIVHQSVDPILSILDGILSGIPGAALLSAGPGVRLEEGVVDADCAVQIPSGRMRVLVMYSADGLPGTIRRLAPRLRALRDAFDDTDMIALLAAPYITEDGLDVCKEERLACIDKAGNCLLPFPGAYVEIRGRKNPNPVRRSIRSLFSPKSSRIPRVLLSDTGRSWQVQEIAEAAGISNALVSRLKNRLLEEDLVMFQNRRMRVRSPRRILDEWAMHYSYRRNTIGEFYTPAETAEAEKEIVSWCEAHGVLCALGLFSAAARIAPHVRMNRCFLFVDAEPGFVARATGLKPVVSGGNVILLQPYDDGVFFDGSERDGLPLTSSVQTWLDLVSYKGRGEEAANFLMQHTLESEWEQQRTTRPGT